jgi:uncharacterized protein (DUF302 family)
MATPLAVVFASDLIMARSHEKFPEAMLTLQTSVKEHGYTVARVQRIDIGLTGMGYKTDKYRVVFVGKKDEIQYLTKKYPDLTPYMPPKVSIFAEDEDTVIVTVNPAVYKEMIDDEEDRRIFDRWENDVYSVFKDFSEAAEE